MHSGGRTYYVYIITNRSKTLYIGVTNDGERRMWEHKHHSGSDFARRYKLDRPVYWESFDDLRNAIDREKQIKAWLRIKKLALIVVQNPPWSDLSAERFRRHPCQPDETSAQVLRCVRLAPHCAQDDRVVCCMGAWPDSTLAIHCSHTLFLQGSNRRAFFLKNKPKALHPAPPPVSKFGRRGGIPHMCLGSGVESDSTADFRNWRCCSGVVFLG